MAAASHTLSDPTLLRTQALIAGQWQGGSNGATFEVDDPAAEAPIARVASLGAAETRQAIDAAQAALPAWSAQLAQQRADILHRWHDLIRANENDLAAILTWEQGKPLAEALGEIRYGASYVEWYAEEAKRVYGEIVPPSAAGRRTLVLRQPVGVVGVITPWNFPSALQARKGAPALAVGCTVVLKPAEATPLSALALAELAIRAGMPPGVFNVVTGPPAAIGEELCGNPLVRHLTFTGSTATGRLLMRQCAATVKRLSLELGGNAPFIVCEDADIEAAVAGAVASKFRASGQTCVCANRLLVHERVHDAFVARLAAAASELKVGGGFEPDVRIGPLINAAAVAKVERLVADALAAGAKAVIGGKRHARGGRFYEPTVLTGVTKAMACSREEIFGPVAPVLRVRDDDEALRLANDTPFGLAAYVYTRSAARQWRFAEQLECGIVGVNEGIVSTAVAPFGGVKESGFGREGGRQGVEEFLNTKYVCLGGL